MAKVTAPLLSLDASGTYASSLNYTKYGVHNIARKKRIAIAPFDPKTEIQLFNRFYFGNIVRIWQQFSPELKQSLDILGNVVAYSGFNLYIKAYRERRPTESGNTMLGFSELGDLTF